MSLLMITCKLRVTPAHYGVLVKSQTQLVMVVQVYTQTVTTLSAPHPTLFSTTMCHSYMHVYIAVKLRKMPALVHLGVL